MRDWLRRVRRLDRDYMGINRRNLELVDPLNPRPRRCFVDDKLLCKKRLTAVRVPVPETLAVFEGFRDLRDLDSAARRWVGGFVVKPAQSSGGQGILVVREDDHGGWRRPGRRGARPLSASDLREHVAQILGGMYSNGRNRDAAFVEELIEPHAGLAALGEGGLPDVRVVVHRGRAVQAMLRVATSRSGGRANLHQGAIGIGVDLDSGRTRRAVCEGRRIERHPDGGARLVDLSVPFWPDVLDVALRSAQAFDLGYLGVDVVVDASRGPLVLEVNARPGLAIQLANGRGLRAALRRLESTT